jgi:cytidylate kinase
LEENRWPKELAEKITEDKRLFIDELMDDLFGLRPPSWVLVPQVVETMLRLAMAGHAILVGHGATVVTAKLSNVFHVRLTSSLTRRIERVQKLRNLTPEAAAKFVRKEDRGRARFVKAHFHARLDNELLYDLAVNTDRVSIDDAVAVIVEGARRFFSVL